MVVTVRHSVICEPFYVVSGVVLCKLNDWSSAEQVLSGSCRSECTHARLQLAVLDQLGDCFAAQVSLTLLHSPSYLSLSRHPPSRMLWQRNAKIAQSKRLQILAAVMSTTETWVTSWVYQQSYSMPGQVSTVFGGRTTLVCNQATLSNSTCYPQWDGK